VRDVMAHTSQQTDEKSNKRGKLCHRFEIILLAILANLDSISVPVATERLNSVVFAK
jgi:hypothetical protein